jgi:methylated-DNA-protein-cysteine methyltransferase-like protein
MMLSAATIYAVVRSIPRGKVATYGQISELAGVPNGHRIVARAMRCWRVVGKKDIRRGQIAIGDPDHAALQRGLLESEGIVFDASGFIPLARFGWRLDEPSSERGEARRRAPRGASKRRAKRPSRAIRS